MLKQLQDLASVAFVDAGATRRPFGVPPDWSPGTPADVLEVARHWCAGLRDRPRPPAPSLAQQGAIALIDYVADLPDDVHDAITPLPAFRDDIERAWQEPCADTFVSLCNTVQDVWAHACGPESRTDAQVIDELLARPSRTALDFGAGAGHYAVALARQGVQVDAVEIDAVKTSFLAYRAKAAGVGDRLQLGLRWTSYDAVLAIDVLDHLQDPLAALRSLIGRLAPGGHLYALAQFPDDGWHQSAPSAVTACGDLLWTALRPVPALAADVPWLDVFMKPAAPATAGGSDKPRLHPRAQFQRGDAGWTLAATAFYAGICAVDDDTARFCRLLDGSRSLAELSRSTGYEPAEIDELCGLLHQQRLLHWDAAATAGAR